MQSTNPNKKKNWISALPPHLTKIASSLSSTILFNFLQARKPNRRTAPHDHNTRQHLDIMIYPESYPRWGKLNFIHFQDTHQHRKFDDRCDGKSHHECVRAIWSMIFRMHQMCLDFWALSPNTTPCVGDHAASTLKYMCDECCLSPCSYCCVWIFTNSGLSRCWQRAIKFAVHIDAMSGCSVGVFERIEQI